MKKGATRKATKAKPAKAKSKVVKRKAAAKGKSSPVAKKAATKKPAAKKPAAAKPAVKAAAKRPAAGKPRAGKPKAAPKAPAGTPLAPHTGKAMIIQILGDAEAYFFDYDQLSDAQRRELVEYHLAAWDARQRAEGDTDWAATFVPVGLIGESMPPDVRGRFDLSAPHEGVMLFHRPTGALLHASSKHDDRLAVMAPDVETISPMASFVDEVFDPADQSFAYAVNRAQSEGFTRANIAMLMQTGGAELILV